MKQILVLFLTVLVFANNLTVFAQRKTEFSPKPPPKVIDLGSNNPLDNFSEKGLPEPELIGENPSDELAARFAKDISKFEDNSLPLLMAMLQKAGFYIIDTNQKTLYKPVVGEDMQMAFYDFEVAGMLRASANGMGTTIEKFSKIIARNHNLVDAAKFGQNILADLRKARESSNKRVRFAAALIFEFGKNFQKPVDLTKTSPENSLINFIQLSLIERILLGDLMDAYEKLSGGNSLYKKQNLPQPNGLRFVKASFLNKFDTPCETLGDLTVIRTIGKSNYDFVVKVSTFSATIGGNAAQNQFLEQIGQGLDGFNTISSWIKLLSASLKVEIEITGIEPTPVERTKSNTTQGDERELKAKLKMDLLDKEKAKQISCLAQLAEIKTGQKFKLPQPADLEGQEILWETRSEENFGFEDKTNNELSSFVGSNTDSNGEAKARLIGRKQREDLTNRKVFELPSTFDFFITVRFKRADFGKSQILSLFENDQTTTGILEAFNEFPELIGKTQRTRKAFRVPIKDWQPCKEQWGGIITYKYEYINTNIQRGQPKPNGNKGASGIRLVWKKHHATIMLKPLNLAEKRSNPTNDPSILQPSDAPFQIDSLIQAVGENGEELTAQSENEPCCNPEIGKEDGGFFTQFTEKKLEKWNQLLEKPVNVLFDTNGRDFGLSIFVNRVVLKSTTETTFQVEKSNCQFDKDGAGTNTVPSAEYFEGSFERGRYGEFVANQSGEFLIGEKPFFTAEGGSGLWKWNLARCTK